MTGYNPSGPPDGGPRLLVELYAVELADQAAAVAAVPGLNAEAAEAYKTRVYQATKSLKEAGAILRASGVALAPVSKQEPTPIPETKSPWGDWLMTAATSFAASGLGALAVRLFLGK